MLGRIMALCRAMGASEDQEELLLPLVQTLQEQLAGRLKEGARPEDCGPSFPLAVAMTAMDRLSAMTGGGGGGVASFTAGDLTIRREAGSASGGGLAQQADRLLGPWLGETGFAFKGVEG